MFNCMSLGTGAPFVLSNGCRYAVLAASGSGENKARTRVTGEFVHDRKR